MATVLQPIVNELSIVLVQLRTELRGLQTDADGAGIAIKISKTREKHVRQAASLAASRPGRSAVGSAIIHFILN